MKKIFISILLLLFLFLLLFIGVVNISNIKVETQIVDVVNKKDNISANSLRMVTTNTLSNPSDPNNIGICINKNNNLSGDYEPQDLVYTNIRFLNDKFLSRLRSEAAQNLENLFVTAESEGIYLYGVSGYRSYDYQGQIYNPTSGYSAAPGSSEHQLGLAMDVSNESIGCNLIEEFGESAEGIWLRENCHKFGFIIRYPKDKEEITGYKYEPWHIRYVGINLATILMEKNITLEEYYKL